MNDDLAALIHRHTVAGGFANTVAIAEEAFEMGRVAGQALTDAEAEPEQMAWDWIYGEYQDPADRAFSSDEMVDAFIAGRQSLSASPLPGREEIARVIWESPLFAFPRNDWDTESAQLPKSARVRLVRQVADSIASLSTPPTEGFSKAWCEKMANAEGDAEIGAGVVAIDPVLCSDCPPVGYPTDKTRCEGCPRKGTPK